LNRVLIGPVESGLEALEAREHSCRLDELYVFVELDGETKANIETTRPDK
jgi:hypothetical protein